MNGVEQHVEMLKHILFITCRGFKALKVLLTLPVLAGVEKDKQSHFPQAMMLVYWPLRVDPVHIIWWRLEKRRD